MKRAIIYYSLSNNTKTTAETLAAELGADLYRLDFVKPLPTSKAGQMFEGGRQASFGIKPEITGMPKDLSSYDALLMGTPIWAGRCASPFNTAMENREFCEKVTAVFTYSGGGDNAGCMKFLGKKLPNIKCNVGFADSKTKFAAWNEEKMKEFLKKL